MVFEPGSVVALGLVVLWLQGLGLWAFFYLRRLGLCRRLVREARPDVFHSSYVEQQRGRGLHRRGPAQAVRLSDQAVQFLVQRLHLPCPADALLGKREVRIQLEDALVDVARMENRARLT